MFGWYWGGAWMVLGWCLGDVWVVLGWYWGGVWVMFSWYWGGVCPGEQAANSVSQLKVCCTLPASSVPHLGPVSSSVQWVDWA